MVNGTWVRIKSDGSIVQDINGGKTFVEADGSVLKKTEFVDATMSKGGHNEDSFNALASSDPNINIGTSSQVAPGIRSIEYTVKKDDGSISAVRTKTVYDPNVYSDKLIAKMSTTAISKAPPPTAGSNLSKINVKGLEFTITHDPLGNVNNVFVSGAA